MTNLSFSQLNDYFRGDNFPAIENDQRGIRFLKLRSMSRSETMEEFCNNLNIDVAHLQSKEYFSFIFDRDSITDDQINSFIRAKYSSERQARIGNEDNLVDQLSRVLQFDWGGSFGNSLEKNIVDNYVKRIRSYERINEEIEGNLLSSLRGYTINSWYNHWTSILIEDLFKDHRNVQPTIGLIKKIDFFIDNTPFDLKVTYYPEQLLAEKLRENGYGNELTELKRICRSLRILIPADLGKRELRIHLYNRVAEDQRDNARSFIVELKRAKKRIIDDSKADPGALKVWFYENQGEARFDASNRFFLVLTDENDINNSWKLKRNIPFLRERINNYLDTLLLDRPDLQTQFYWEKTQRMYTCKSAILFVSYE
jgi:hypothetical protein